MLKTLIAPVEHVNCEDESEVQDILSKISRVNPETIQPLHHLTICQTAEGKVVAKLTVHHSIIDGPTILTIFTDLARAYDGNLSETKAPIFEDYISHLERIGTKSALDYWRASLSNTPPCLFPVEDRPVESVKELESVVKHVGNDYRLRDFCEQHEVTVPSLVYLLWTLVLQNVTGDDSVSFGYLSSARAGLIGEMADAAGFMVDHVISSSKQFKTTPALVLLQQIHDKVLSNMPHQHVSSMDIAGALDLTSPLFNTLVNFRKFDLTEVDVDMQDIEDEETPELNRDELSNLGIGFKAISGNDPMAVSYNIEITSSDDMLIIFPHSMISLWPCLRWSKGCTALFPTGVLEFQKNKLPTLLNVLRTCLRSSWMTLAGRVRKSKPSLSRIV